MARDHLLMARQREISRLRAVVGEDEQVIGSSRTAEHPIWMRGKGFEWNADDTATLYPFRLLTNPPHDSLFCTPIVGTLLERPQPPSVLNHSDQHAQDPPRVRIPTGSSFRGARPAYDPFTHLSNH